MIDLPFEFECFIHDFKTKDPEEWDRHCYYTDHENITTNEAGEQVREPYPRHHMRDALTTPFCFGPFSKKNPPSAKLIKALEENDIATLIKIKNKEVKLRLR